jgi:hypothetical protein
MALLQQHSSTNNQKQVPYSLKTVYVHKILTQGRDIEKLTAFYNEHKLLEYKTEPLQMGSIFSNI